MKSKQLESERSTDGRVDTMICTDLRIYQEEIKGKRPQQKFDFLHNRQYDLLEVKHNLTFSDLR